MPWVQALHDFLWGLTVDWVVLVGLFLTLGLQFQPVWRLPWALRLLVQAIRRPRAGPGEISSIAALMTSLGGTLGVGQLSGMVISLSIGGPGVVPWMWLVTVLGLATRFSETYLAVRFRRRDDRGQVIGGPMEAIQTGLGQHWQALAVLFAVFGTVGVFGPGNGLQVQHMAQALHHLSGLPPLAMGLVASALAAWVLCGGLGRISRMALLLVPLMMLVYLLTVAVLLGVHAAQVPAALGTMLNAAFKTQALSGGALALMLRTAVRSAVFANDTGLGTNPIAFAAAAPADPRRQGAISMLDSVFSMLVCTATALVLLVSGTLDDPTALQTSFLGDPGGMGLLLDAFSSGLAGSDRVVSLVMALFSFTTLVTFGFYGERCITFLVGPRGRRPFQLVWIGIAAAASSNALPDLWVLANTLDALMVLPNLLVLLLLSGSIFQAVVPSRGPS